ncbi:hypothetical protein F5141DRAFT_1120797 [Pisolithus sp. B1]|nr:hypothetical protein F5141DRAFT_1120797 [Pisolithus sp. B1]
MNPNRNREADMEAITSAVAAALRPVTTRLDVLQQRLDSVGTHIQNNTVTAHGQMLQTHLGTLRTGILADIGQHLTPLNTNVVALQNGTMETNQNVAELRQLLQAARNDIGDAQHAINQHVAQVFIRGCQSYNSGCGFGFTRPFRVVPLVGADGSLQLPSVSLPRLLNTRVISDLTDDELDQYLQIYEIQVDSDGQNRRERLSQLRGHIGYVPPDSFTSYGVAIFSLLMGVFSYMFLFFVAALVSGRGPWLLISL